MEGYGRSRQDASCDYRAIATERSKRERETVCAAKEFNPKFPVIQRSMGSGLREFSPGFVRLRQRLQAQSIARFVVSLHAPAPRKGRNSSTESPSQGGGSGLSGDMRSGAAALTASPNWGWRPLCSGHARTDNARSVGPNDKASVRGNSEKSTC